MWASLGIALAINCIHKFTSNMNYGELVLGLAWLLMAAAWFMQPVILKANLKLSEMFKAQSSYAIGSPLATIVCSIGGVTLMIIGFALKLVSAI